jgi:hypothetical protein
LAITLMTPTSGVVSIRVARPLGETDHGHIGRDEVNVSH